MKKKIAALVCAAFAASSLIAAETIASFTSPAKGDTNNGYTVAGHESGYGFSITGSQSWSVSEGTTIIVSYSGLPSSGDQAIVTLQQSNGGSYTSLVGVGTTNCVLNGIWQGAWWSKSPVGETLPSSGTIVFVSIPNKTNDTGVYAYDTDGNILYEASRLRSIDNGTTTGTRFDFGGTAGDSLYTTGFSVTYVEILKGALSATEIAERFGEQPCDKHVLSVNFMHGAANSPIASAYPDELVGLSGYAVLGSKWIDVNANSSSVAQMTMAGEPTGPISVTYTDNYGEMSPYVSIATYGCCREGSNGVGTYCGKQTVSSGNTALLYGYIDDTRKNNAKAGVKFTNLPVASTYTAVIYFNSDTSGTTIIPIYVNGTYYTAVDGKTCEGTSNWGSPYGATAISEGVNALVVSNLTATTLEIKGKSDVTSGRGTIAGVQIVFDGGVASGVDFVGNLTSATATLGENDTSGMDMSCLWENGTLNTATLTNNLASATVTLENGFTAGTLNIIGSGDTTVSGDDAAIAIVNTSEASGKTTLDFPLTNATVVTLGSDTVVTKPATSASVALTEGQTLTLSPGSEVATSLTATGAGKVVVTNGTVTASGSIGTDIDVAQGATLKLGTVACLGSAGNGATASGKTIAVAGTLDLNGVEGVNNYTLAEGGVLQNTGDAIANTSRQTTQITLAGNATVNAASNFGFIGSRYNATSLNLGGYTLTKTGSGSFWMCNTAISNPGSIVIQEGSIVVHRTACSTMPPISGAGTLECSTSSITVGVSDVDFTGGLSVTSPVSIADGSTVSFGSAAHFGGDVTIPADATVTFKMPAGAEYPFTVADGTVTVEDGAMVALVDSTGAALASRYFLNGNEVVIAIATVGETTYYSLADAVEAAGNGGTITLLVSLEEAGSVPGIVLDATETEGVYTVSYNMASSGLRISEIMPKGADGELDPNGLEAGWIEFENTNADAWVDLADYRLIRVNRGKKTDTSKFSNLATRLVPPGGFTVVYTSEQYPNAEREEAGSGKYDDSMFIAGPHDGITVTSYPNDDFPDLEEVMVFPAKINPKKFAFVRLYSAPGGTVGDAIDTVVIPSDLPESNSIIVGTATDEEATKRWICPTPTKGAANGDTAALVKLGPNVGPLYEGKKLKKHDSASEFARPAPPAKAGEAYDIVFSANPVMNPNGSFTPRAKDVITNITMEVRTDLTNTWDLVDVDLSTLSEDTTDWGNSYTATIPQTIVDAVEAGHLIQWRFHLTDAAGNTWKSPSFNNPDDGYEWYGTIKEPDSTQMSSKLTTMHLFALPGVADTPGVHNASAMMNIDVDASGYDATRARVGIYDSSTSNYYDYVRIDLRGNSSADFIKKSHGLRFAKTHPITTYNCITGENIPEVRKTSFISEFADPSYIRQLLAFWFFNQNGSPAPYDFPVRLNLNGVFYQLGFMSQRFNDELIEDCYGLDPYGYGYKNIGPFTGSTTAGSIEKKTPDDGNESDLTELNEFCAKLPTTTVYDDATYTQVAAEEMDLPAWFNYIAISRITHENDDVWANISGYWDNRVMRDGTEGTGTWRPLAYDMNLSFGQWYYNDASSVGRIGLTSDWDWFKSHPFYGGFAVRCHNSTDASKTVGNANRVYEAIFQSTKFRRLYLRRLRTLMDTHLGEPGSDEYATSTLPLFAKMRELEELMSEDAATDRALWGPLTTSASGAYEINVWGSAENQPTNMTAGIKDIWDNYIVPRRVHLYNTHSVTNEDKYVGYGSYEYSAGIPAAQSAISDLKDGISLGYDATIGAVVISNANAEAIDMSGWTLAGPVAMTLPEGTVIDMMVDSIPGEVYVTADRRATVEAMTVTDEIIVGNGTAGSATDFIILTATDGTVIETPQVTDETIDWTVGSNTYTFDVLFRGTSDATWEENANWYSTTISLSTLSTGVTTNWTAYSGTGSIGTGSGEYIGTLLDGDLMALEASESGVKNVTAELQEGWNSKIGVKNGVNLTITHLNKVQKGSAGTAYWVVDDTSKITVTDAIINWNDSNKYGQFTGHTFDVASENGVVFNGTIGNNAANTFILHEAGSVAFADVTASGTWTVSATLDLGEAGDMAKEVVTRPLVTGTSLSAVTFAKGTFDSLDGTALTEGTVTEDSAIGTYELVSSSTGYSVKYVKRASAEASTEVGGVTYYGTLQDMVALAGDGGTVTLYRALTESDATNCAATFTATETENVYTIALTKADSAALRISEIMPKGADGELDPNGFESGWIEFHNASETAWVDLADYRLIRVNRGKKTDTSKFSNLATRLVPPGGYTIVYMTECYPNGPYGVGDDSRFINGGHDGITVESYPDSQYFTDANPVMVFPAKANPKKFPFLRLYYAPGVTTLKGKMTSVVDTVIIPDDLPESASILLADAAEGEATKRWICTSPTPGEANGDTANLKRIGPNVGPLYENSSLAKHSNVSAFGRLAPPAKAGEDYNITFSANPVMNPTGKAGEAARSEDAITSITLEYRIDLTNDVQAIAVDTNTLDTADMLDWGNTYTATIPQSVIDAVEPGHLIQWRFKLTDAEGNEWTSPSFNNSDDGYEWFGTIKEPDASLISSKLTTMHLFAKPGVADTPGVHDADAMMNIDVDDSRYDATQARVAIYDSSTSNYYDYVRIDLRGNSSKDFRKKSHGLRFAKAHPITTYNCITGAMIPEVRKTSFIGEFCDPTEMRQLLAFWFFNRHNSPAPYDFPVRLNLNGEFYQLGFMSQRFNDELIEDCYGLDPLGYGYKNIGPFNGSSTSAGSIEKKTPDDGNESDLDELDEFCAKLPTGVATGSDTYSKVAAKEMDLPAWFNYIALSKITHECDDVWANISGYWDYAKMHDGARGTGTWRPLAYDMNLSFGQWYYNDVYNGKNEHDGPGLVSDWDWFKSHPFYGGFVVRAHRGDGGSTVGNANRAYEAIFQNEKFRRLYLRRLRTLMDSELGAPGSDTYETSQIPLAVKIRELAELMAEDAALDRETWGQLGYTANGAYEVNVWGTQLPTNLTEAVADVWDNYIVPRRTHLFVTHSATNTANTIGYGTYLNAGIPESQSAIEDLKAGFSISNASDTDEDGVADTISDSEKVVITNANDEAVDMSGWKLTGRFAMTLPEGTVIDQNGSIIVVVDRLQYVTDHDSEITDDIIVGNATLDDSTTSLTLSDANGTEVAKVVLPSDVSKYLRIFAFDGAPVADDDYGTDEWIMLTNISDTVTLDLAGVNVKAGKDTTDPKCNVTIESGTLAPGGTITLRSEDFGTAKGWEKITNGAIYLQITDANGTIGQTSEAITQKNFPTYRLANAYLQVTTFGATFGEGDLIVVGYPATTIEVAPGANTVLDVTTAEEATNALANCEIALSAEDTAAGLVTNVLKLVVVDTGSGFAAAVDVDETKVASPVIGEITEGETTVEPMTVTKEEGGSKVTVGVTNATIGLWYGFEWATALDGGFADDAGSFKRATGASVKLEATPRTDAKAFYKVKVSASKPQEVQ